MLNLVILSLGIVASKAALSCNGASFRSGGMEMVVAAGVCTGAQTAGQVSSAQYVCKGGKINFAAYTSSSDCTGDSQEVEVCSNAAYTDCTSVCDQDPCEYIKAEIYTGVTSCDPIVVDSGALVTTGYVSGQCQGSVGGSVSWSCDSSAGTATQKTYTSADCTVGSTDVSFDLETLCDASTGMASTYSCGTANKTSGAVRYSIFGAFIAVFSIFLR